MSNRYRKAHLALARMPLLQGGDPGAAGLKMAFLFDDPGTVGKLTLPILFYIIVFQVGGL